MKPQSKDVKAPITNANTVQILKLSQAKITEPNSRMNKEMYLYSSWRNAAAPFNNKLILLIRINKFFLIFIQLICFGYASCYTARL